MDTPAKDFDVENPKDELLRQSQFSHADLTKSSLFMEAAALLTIWSILVINEGAIRLVDSNPAAGFADGRPPNLVLFLAGLAEVFFGLVGLFVGMAGFIFRWYNAVVTMVSITIQTLLGYFVFAVYVFVKPAFQATDLTEDLTLAGLTLGQQKFVVALGVLTSFHFCLALQGGQFVFFARLITFGSGRNFLMQRTGNRMRAVFWNANLGLAGIWTLITGVLINSNVGSGKLSAPFVSPPNVGRLPGLTITTGLLMILWASVGIFLALSNRSTPWFYFLLSGLVYVFAYLNYTIVQFGLMIPPPKGSFGGPVAMHGGLVCMVVFLGPYFLHLSSKEKKGGAL